MFIATIIGVRPQFVKASVLTPIIRKEHKEILIHTGQHYDDNMSAVFFRELGLPEPDYVLNVNCFTNAEVDYVKDVDVSSLLAASFSAAGAKQENVKQMVRTLIPVLQKEKVDAVLLYGDTNTTLAGALAAACLQIPSIHVEAGERNRLVNNPEERIRKTVDHISSLLLCSSKQAIDNLQSEGLGERGFFIGNLMEFSFLKNIHKSWKPNLLSLTSSSDMVISIPHNFYLLTCHRQENANEINLTEILLAMEQANYPVIFPVHPRNKEKVLQIYNSNKLKNIILTEPVAYFDSIHLIKNAETVVTDSGGVMQEAHFAQIPYVVVLDIAKVPPNTRFDLSRLAKPEREDILKKLNQKQEFSLKNEEMDVQKDVVLKHFENDVLRILREFEQNI